MGLDTCQAPSDSLAETFIVGTLILDFPFKIARFPRSSAFNLLFKWWNLDSQLSRIEVTRVGGVDV
jgi:hypothetical protein